MQRICAAAIGMGLVLVAFHPASAGDKAADKPSVVVRVQSLNALLDNLDLVVDLVGQKEAVQLIKGAIKSRIGAKGLEGIDPARPFGAYLRFGKAIDDIHGAILIPMTDAKTFLALLESLNLEVKKDKNDIYTYKTNKNIDVYFRFAHEYLFVTTVNTESIQDKNLSDPKKALALPGNAAISILARMDQLPNDAKLIALAQLEETILAAQKGPDDEPKVQKEIRVALLRDANKIGARLIREAEEIRFDLDVNKKTKLIVHASVTGKPGSELAKTIQEMGALKSTLAGFTTKDVAFHGAVHLLAPDAVKESFSTILKEVADRSIESIQNPQKKKQAEVLFNGLMPTAQSGEFHLVGAALGPKGSHYALIAALKIKNADALGNTVFNLVKDALKDIPAEQQAKIELDFDKVGAIKIHKFEAPKHPTLDKVVAEIAGDKYLYLAFRDDGLFLALGKDSLAVLKSALAQKDPVPSTPLVFDFDFGRMANLLAQTQEQKDTAVKLFPANQPTQVQLEITGGTSLGVRLQMELQALKFLMNLGGKRP